MPLFLHNVPSMRFFLLLLSLALPCASQLCAQCGVAINTFPYNENFEVDQGGWVSGGNASDWAWGTPSKTVINSAGTGTRCWVVGGLSTSFYNLGERSFVESPCFDFTNLPHPYINFKIWWETERRFDGSNLQYSLDQGASWINVGTNTDPVDCLNDNWYNFATITNLTNLVTVRHGWTGNIQPTAGSCQGGFGSGGWLVAKHCMPYLAGVPSVKFRFTFGAGTTCNDYDGFAFDDITIENAPPIVPDFTAVCNGNNTYDFTDISTNCPDTWNWDFGDPTSGAANTSTVQNPNHTYNTPGTYTVSLTAGSVCSGMAIFTKTVTILGVTSNATPVSCSGGSDGSASIVVSPAGGSPVFQWNTTPVQTGSTASNLPAGNYTVIVTQPGSCPLTTVVFVTEAPPITGSIATIPATCGQTNGSATASVSGGTPSYTYNWALGVGTNMNAVNLVPASYDVTVSDSKGCTLVLPFTITSAGGLQVAGSIAQNVQCFGGSDGSATINPPVGNGPFTYNWPAGIANGNTATGLSAGTYIVTVSDANQCTVTTPIVIDAPSDILLQTTTLAASCGQNNGSLSVNASGGTPGYTYSWTPNVSNGPTAANLAPGDYIVVVTDQNSCGKIIDLNVDVTAPPVLSLLDITSISCAGVRDGGISLSVQGTAPFTFQWSPSVSDTAIAVGLMSGTYYITVSDASECSDSIAVTLVPPTPVVTSAYSLGVKCPGESNGQIIVQNTSGGTGPYLYALNQGAFVPDTAFLNLASGMYVLEAQDALGCTDSVKLTVNNAIPNAVNIGPDTVLTAGAIILLNASVLNSGSVVDYQWQPPLGLACDTCKTTLATPSGDITYTVIVTDSNGCVVSDMRRITIRLGEIYIPNVIAPESNLENDRFTLYTESGVDEILLLQIFDRWGDLVFENKNFAPNNAQLGWDGRFREKAVNPGVFTYLFKLKFVDGMQNSVTGTVTIVR